MIDDDMSAPEARSSGGEGLPSLQGALDQRGDHPSELRKIPLKKAERATSLREPWPQSVTGERWYSPPERRISELGPALPMLSEASR